MSEPLPNPSEKQKTYTDSKIIIFIILLCVVCGFLLAAVSFSLQRTQNQAKEFDQSKQMLIAAKILSATGNFQIIEQDGSILPARFDPKTKLLIPLPVVKGSPPPKANEEEIKEIASLRIRSLVTDHTGNIYTLEEKNITLADYLSSNKKTGFATLPLKLFYAILPNSEEAQKLSAEEVAKNIDKAEMVVIPVSGFGLWAPIYGFIAIGRDADSVIGTTWYEHAETPGLGANITEFWWQKQFYEKEIFQPSSDGSTDFKTANMGIIVVKGAVKDVFGTSPKARSAVDGMSGATLTGDGVTQAYRNSLTPYRPFLIKIHQMNAKENGHGGKKSST